MYRILTLNEISDIIYTQLDDSYRVSAQEAAPHGVLVRSAAMHEMEMPQSLLAIARAGAGVNNIPLDKCSQQGICVFNTPGANANAVCELVIAGLLMASRDLVRGVNWAQTLKGKGADVPKLVEKGKSAFTGPEVRGKKLGIVGLGAIGTLVANAAIGMGMEVLGFDPTISVEHAWKLSRSVHRANTLEELLAACDYVTVHIPLMEKTKGMFNAQLLGKMKQDATLLNFSRAELVDSAALLEALAKGSLRAYVTDFPTEEMLDVPHVLPIPHLGASTPESEENCAVMAAQQIRDYLEQGSIKNAVNLPDVELAPTTKPRLAIIHQNIPNVLGTITSAVASLGINISDLTNRSRGAMAYTVLDLDEAPANGDALLAKLGQAEGMIRVRPLNL